jgi:cell division FtsZ-interacting protein ZapD
MNAGSGVGGKSKAREKGLSYFCLLGVIRSRLEKHGGSLTVDEETNTIALSLPNDKKEACYEELKATLDTIKPLFRLRPL